jgi:hypothetical protein
MLPEEAMTWSPILNGWLWPNERRRGPVLNWFHPSYGRTYKISPRRRW